MRNELDYSASLILAFVVLVTTVLMTRSTAQAETIKWGADSEGGAPFVFQSPEDPTVVIGFEKDIVEALSIEMGVTPQLVQNSWDGLIPGLNRGNYDFTINGIEITDDRKEEVLFSDPYYITHQQLVVRKEENGITNLANCRGKKIGTLKFSLAHTMLEQYGGLEIVAYDAEANAYKDLSNGRVEAVLLDAPIALYYGVADPKLKLVGEPIGRMTYGIAIKRDNSALLLRLNTAIASIRDSGKLKEIYDRWGLWNSLMEAEWQSRGLPTSQALPPVKYRAFLKASGIQRSFGDVLMQYVGFSGMLLKGAAITLQISLVSMVLAVSLGLVLTLMRLYLPAPFSTIAMLYVEIVRGTPLLIQLFFIFYGLPNVGIKLSPFVAAVLGLGLNYAAYEAENYRAGILSIPRAQFEAAFALGMNQAQTLRKIVVPQAMRLVMPPVTNDFISLLKDSSLVSVITMVELTKVYGQLASATFDYFGIGIIVAILYLLLGLPFVKLAKVAERYYSRYALTGVSRAAR